jgi:hypothetical protein
MLLILPIDSRSQDSSKASCYAFLRKENQARARRKKMNESKYNHKLILPDRLYDICKFIALWVFPELMVIYSLGGALLGWPHADFVCGGLASVAALIGGLAGVSSHNYQGSKKHCPECESLSDEERDKNESA